MPRRNTRNRTPRTVEGSPPAYNESKSETPPPLPPYTLMREDEKTVPKPFNWGLVSRFAPEKPENDDGKEYSGKIMVYVTWLNVLTHLEQGDASLAKFYLHNLVSTKRYIFGDILSNLKKVRDLYFENHTNPSALIMLGSINETLFSLQ